jgi:hypothetical protein
MAMDDGYLDVRHLVVLIVLGLIVAVALALLPKVWRMEADIQKDEATARWWPFGDALRAGFLRSLPTGVVSALFLELAAIAGFFEKLLGGGEGGRLAGRFTLWLGLLFVLMLFVDLSVTLFNWPKFAVSPAARDEPGALATWWSSRKYKPQR